MAEAPTDPNPRAGKYEHVVVRGTVVCEVLVKTIRRSLLAEFKLLLDDVGRPSQIVATPLLYRQRVRRKLNHLARTWMTGITRTYINNVRVGNQVKEIAIDVESKPCNITVEEIAMPQDKNVRLLKPQRSRNKYRKLKPGPPGQPRGPNQGQPSR
jgi:hypothetical protein